MYKLSHKCWGDPNNHDESNKEAVLFRNSYRFRAAECKLASTCSKTTRPTRRKGRNIG